MLKKTMAILLLVASVLSSSVSALAFEDEAEQWGDSYVEQLLSSSPRFYRVNTPSDIFGADMYQSIFDVQNSASWICGGNELRRAYFMFIELGDGVDIFDIISEATLLYYDYEYNTSVFERQISENRFVLFFMQNEYLSKNDIKYVNDAAGEVAEMLLTHSVSVMDFINNAASYVADTCSYDYEKVGSGDQICHTALGVFERKTAVCDGYASAYTYILNSLGVASMVVTSNSHAWNAILYQNRLFFSDVTWYDNESGAYNDHYIMMTLSDLNALTDDSHELIEDVDMIYAFLSAKQAYLKEALMSNLNTAATYASDQFDDRPIHIPAKGMVVDCR